MERRAAARGKGGRQRYEEFTHRGLDCRRAVLAPGVVKAICYYRKPNGDVVSEHYALAATWNTAKRRAEQLADEVLDKGCLGCDHTAAGVRGSSG